MTPDKLFADGSPLLVGRKTLSEHVYIRGSPGSGKSAALTMLIEQILSLGDSTVHIFDLKDNNTLELSENAARVAPDISMLDLDPMCEIPSPESRRDPRSGPSDAGEVEA